MDLTNEQWNLVEPLIPRPSPPRDNRGHPWRDSRDVLNGILWVLRTDLSWRNLPERYPPFATCNRRLRQWVDDETIQCVFQALAGDLVERGGIDISEAFVTWYFRAANKRSAAWLGSNTARDGRSWQLQTLKLLLSPSTLKVLCLTKRRHRKHCGSNLGDTLMQGVKSGKSKKA